MQEFTTWSEVFFDSLGSVSQKLMKAIPGILGAILILSLGWIFAKVVSNAITRLLRLAKFDLIAEKIKATEYLEKANVTLTPSGFIGKFVYWGLLLLVVISASDALGWNAVSEEISKLLGFLPNLLFSVIFFIIGTYIATFARGLIRGTTASLGISTGKIIGNFVFYLLFIIVTLTALEQAGVDTSIITSNLLLILGAMLAAGALSYSFASKDVLSNILASFFSRKTFCLGQTIEIDGERGKIVAVNNISVTIQNKDKEKIVIPSHQLITNKVKIIGD